MMIQMRSFRSMVFASSMSEVLKTFYGISSYKLKDVWGIFKF
jgi:hypothetical protein